MKNNIILALFALYLSSCATARENTYKTLDIISKTVHISLEAYADARVAGKVDDATHLKVVEMKKQYERIMVASITAAQLDLNSASPEELTKIANQLIQVINSIIK